MEDLFEFLAVFHGNGCGGGITGVVSIFIADPDFFSITFKESLFFKPFFVSMKREIDLKTCFLILKELIFNIPTLQQFGFVLREHVRKPFHHYRIDRIHVRIFLQKLFFVRDRVLFHIRWQLFHSSDSIYILGRKY